jgi:hypothetical protein
MKGKLSNNTQKVPEIKSNNPHGELSNMIKNICNITNDSSDNKLNHDANHCDANHCDVNHHDTIHDVNHDATHDVNNDDSKTVKNKIRNKKIKKKKEQYTRDSSGNIIVCIGITSTYNKCSNYATNNTPYCDSHHYFVNFTTLQIELIKIKNEDCKKCRQCVKFHFGTTSTCAPCLAYKAEQKQLIDADIPPSRDNKCIDIDRNGNPCRNYKKNNTDYCGYHQDQVDLTQEEKDKQVKCSGCNKKKDCKGNDTCESCINRPVKRAELLKKNKQDNSLKNTNDTLEENIQTNTLKNINDTLEENIQTNTSCSNINDIKCKGNTQTNTPCNYTPLKDEEYCGKHINHAKYLEQAKITNTKLCANIGHNVDCQKYLPLNYSFTSCQNCRDQEITKTKNTRNNILNNNNIIINDPNNTEKIIRCTECPIQFKYGSTVTARGKFSMKCSSCFIKQQNLESNRSRNK